MTPPLSAPLQSIAAAFGAPAADAAGAAAPALPALPALPAVDGSQGGLLLEGWDPSMLPPLPAAGGNLEAPPSAVQVGPQLKMLGRMAVGQRVERYWPEEGARALGSWGAAKSGVCHALVHSSVPAA